MPRTLFLCALVALAAGCVNSKAAVPDALALDHVRVPIQQERGLLSIEAIHFEGYTADQIDRSWTSSQSTRVRQGQASVAEQSQEQTYKLRLKRPKGEALHVKCHNSAQTQSQDLGLLGLRSQSVQRALRCQISGGVAGELVLANVEGQSYQGVLKLPEQEIQIESQHQYQDSAFRSPTPLGYTLRQEGQVIAQLQTFQDEHALVAPRQKDSTWDGVALIGAALVLYQELGETSR